MTPEETASALPDGDEAATSAPSLLAFPDWLEQNQAAIKEPLQKYRGYSDYVKQETLAQGRYSDTLVDKLDTKLAGLAVESGDYAIPEGQTEYRPADVLARPRSNELPVDSLLRFSSDQNAPEGLREASAAVIARRKLVEEGQIAPEMLAAAEADLRQLATPEIMSRASSLDVKQGNALAAIVPSAAQDGAPTVEINDSLFEFVNDDGTVDEPALGKALKMHGTDPSLIPAIRAKLARPEGYAKTAAEIEKHGEFISKLDTLAATRDADGNYKVHDELKKIGNAMERGNEQYVNEYGLFNLRRSLRGTPLEDATEDELKVYAKDYIDMNAMPEIDAADPVKSLKRLSTGAVVAPLNLMLNEEAFKKAIEDPSVPAAQRGTLKKQQEYAVEANAASIINTLTEATQGGTEFVNYLDAQRTAGKKDAQIVKDWVGMGKFSSTKSLMEGVRSSLGEAVMPFVYIATGADPDGFAMRAMVGAQIEDSNRRAYAQLFGYKHGIGYDLSKLAAPVAVDLGASFLTRGASVAVTTTGKVAAGAAIKSLMRTALTAETRSMAKTWITAAARSGIKEAGLTVTGKETVDQVISMAGRDITSKIVTGTSKATFYASAFNRSATSTYASLSTALSNQQNPDGSPKYSKEEVKEISMTHALAAGSITVGTMGVMAGIGIPGIEKVFGGNLSRGQLNKVWERLRKDVSKLPPGTDMSSAQTMLSSMVKEGVRPIFSTKTLAGKAGNALAALPEPVKGALSEAPEEALDEFMGYFNEAIATGDKIDIRKAATNALYAGSLGIAMGGTVTGITSTVQNRKAPPARVEADIRRERLLEMAGKLESSAPQTAQVFRNYALQQGSLIPQRQQLEGDLKAAKTPEAKLAIQTKIDTLNEQSRPTPTQENIPEADAAEGAVPPPSDAGMAPEGKAAVEGTPEGRAGGTGVAGVAATGVAGVAATGGTGAAAPEVQRVTTTGRAKMAEKILTSAGVDVESASVIGTRLAAQIDPDGNLPAEDFRRKISEAFAAGGGSSDADTQFYSEDPAAYFGTDNEGRTPEQQAEAGRILNENARQQRIRTNRDLANSPPVTRETVETEFAELVEESQPSPEQSGLGAGAATTGEPAIESPTAPTADQSPETEITITGTPQNITDWKDYHQTVYDELATEADTPRKMEAIVQSLNDFTPAGNPQAIASANRILGVARRVFAASQKDVGRFDNQPSPSPTDSLPEGQVAPVADTGATPSEDALRMARSLIVGSFKPGMQGVRPDFREEQQRIIDTFNAEATESEKELVGMPQQNNWEIIGEVLDRVSARNASPTPPSDTLPGFTMPPRKRSLSSMRDATVDKLDVWEREMRKRGYDSLEDFIVAREAELSEDQFDPELNGIKRLTALLGQIETMMMTEAQEARDRVFKPNGEMYPSADPDDIVTISEAENISVVEVVKGGMAVRQEALDAGLDRKTADGLGAAADLSAMFKELANRTPEQLREARVKNYERDLEKLPKGTTIHGSLFSTFIPEGDQTVGIRMSKKGEVEVFASEASWTPQGEPKAKLTHKVGKMLATFPSVADFVDAAYGAPAPAPTSPTAKQIPLEGLSPMMRQYAELRNTMPDNSVLLFKLGDFYEVFFDDARTLAPILNVALTKRGGTPMAGFPYHMKDKAIDALVKSGRTVAIAESPAQGVTETFSPPDTSSVTQRGGQSETSASPPASTPAPATETPEALYGRIKETKALKIEQELAEITSERMNPKSKWYQAAKSETTQRQRKLESLRSDNYADWGIAVDAFDAEIAAKNPISPVWGELFQQLRLPATELSQRLETAGYVKQGELYIFQPAPAATSTPTLSDLFVELPEGYPLDHEDAKLVSTALVMQGGLLSALNSNKYVVQAVRKYAAWKGVPTEGLTATGLVQLMQRELEADSVLAELRGASVDAAEVPAQVSQRDTSKPEQMTPDERKNSAAKADLGNNGIYKTKGEATARLKQMVENITSNPRMREVIDPLGITSEGTYQVAKTNNGKWGIGKAHPHEVGLGLKDKAAVSAEAVDTYGIKLPEGYVKQGDLYVYQPDTPRNTPSSTPSPAVTDPIGYGNSLIGMFPSLKKAGVTAITIEEAMGRLETEWQKKQDSGKATRLDQLVYLANKKNTQSALEGGSIGGIWTRTDNTVAVSKKATPSAMAHEIGHAIMELEYANAPVETKRAVETEYTKWFQAKYGAEGTPSVADQRRIWEWMTDSDWLDPKAPFPQEQRAADWEKYRSSFSEWFADEVAKWAATREKPRSLVDKFFSEISTKLKRLWNEVSSNFAPNETLASWLDSISEVSPSKGGKPRKQLSSTPSSAVTKELDKFGFSEGLTTFLANVAKRGGKQYSGLAKLLLDAGAGDVPVDLAHLANSDFAGQFNPSTGRILINTAKSGPRGAVDTVLHELVHAVTEGSLRNPTPEQAKVIARIERVRRTVIKRAKQRWESLLPSLEALLDASETSEGKISSQLVVDKFRDDYEIMQYATGDIHEFLTHFFTSQRFRDQVSAMTPKSEKNWLMVIADLIADLFTGRTKAQKMEAELRKELTTLITAPRTGLAPSDVVMRLPSQRSVELNNEFNNEIRKYITGNWPENNPTARATEAVRFGKEWLSRSEESARRLGWVLRNIGIDPSERDAKHETVGGTRTPITITIRDAVFAGAGISTLNEQQAKQFIARTIEEELIHASHLESQKRRINGDPYSFDTLTTDTLRIFEDVAGKNSGKKLLETSRAAYRFDEAPRSLIDPDIFVMMTVSGEFIRQIAQLRRSGNITEAAAETATEKLTDWMSAYRDALDFAAQNLDSSFARDIADTETVMQGVRFQPASDARNVARFHQLTESLYRGRDEATAAEIEAWKNENPEKWEELSAMREEVLRAGGWGVKAKHGSTAVDISEFSREKLGTNTGASSARLAFWASESEDVARSYKGSPPVKTLREQERVVESLKNFPSSEIGVKKPGWGDLVLTEEFIQDQARRAAERYEQMMGQESVGRVYDIMLNLGKTEVWNFKGSMSDTGVLSEILESAREKGLDSVVFEDIADPIRATNYAIFDPAQIKSADPISPGLRVTPDRWADAASPDIRFQPAARPAPDFAAAEQKFNNQVNEYVTGNWPSDTAGQLSKIRGFAKQWLDGYGSFLTDEEIETTGDGIPGTLPAVGGTMETGAFAERDGSIGLNFNLKDFITEVASGGSEFDTKKSVARIIQEEVFHAAHLVVVRKNLGRENFNPQTASQQSLFQIEEVLGGETQAGSPAARALYGSFIAYNRGTKIAGKESIDSVSVQDVLTALGKLDDDGKAVYAIMPELARQVVQLRKSGGITEERSVGILGRIKDWFREVMGSLRQVAAEPSIMGTRFAKDVADMETLLGDNDIRFQGLTEQDFTPASLRDTATGFLPDDVTLDDLKLDFADLADITEGLDPVNAENAVHAAVNHALARRAGEAAIPAPVRDGFDSDEAFDAATQEHAAEVARLTDTYELITRGRLTSEAMFRYRTNPSALQRLVDYLTAAIKAAFNRFTARYDTATAVALNRMSRDLARARGGFNHDIEQMATFDPDAVMMLPSEPDSQLPTEQQFSETVQQYVTGTWPDDLAARLTETRDFAKQWLERYRSLLSAEEIETTGDGIEGTPPSPVQSDGTLATTGELGSIRVNFNLKDLIKEVSAGGSEFDTKKSVARMVQEEVFHAAHLAISRRIIGKDNFNSQSANLLIFQQLAEILEGDIRAGSPAARALYGSFITYRRGSKIPGKASIDSVSVEDVLAELGKTPDGGAAVLNLMPELARQVLQLRRSGGITEARSVGIIGNITDWFRETIGAIRSVAGEPVIMGTEFAKDVNSVESILSDNDIRFQPAARPTSPALTPQERTRLEKELLNQGGKVDFLSVLYKDDEWTAASVNKPESDNRYIRRIKEMFVNTDGKLSVSHAKSKKNRKAAISVIEEMMGKMKNNFLEAARREDVDMTLVQIAMGNVDPPLTPDMEKKITDDFIAGVKASEAKIKATYEQEKITNPLDAKDNYAKAITLANAEADRNRKKAIWTAQAAEAEKRKVQQLEALIQLERTAPDTAEVVKGIRGSLNQFQRLAKEVNKSNPEILAIIDQTFGIYLVRSFGIHQDPKQIDLMLLSEDPFYKERKTALVNFFMPMAKEEIIRQYRQDPDFMKTLPAGLDEDAVIDTITTQFQSQIDKRALLKFEDFMLARVPSSGPFAEGSTVANEIQRYMKKSNMPQEFLDALMVNEDPIFNAMNTMMSLGRLVFHSRMLNEIHDSGIEAGQFITEAEMASGITYADGKNEMRRVFGVDGTNENIKAHVVKALTNELMGIAKSHYANGVLDTMPDRDTVKQQAEKAMKDFASAPTVSLADLLPQLGRSADRFATDAFISYDQKPVEVINNLQPRPGRFSGWLPVFSSNQGNSAFAPLGGLLAEPEYVKAMQATFKVNSKGVGHFSDDFMGQAHRYIVGAAGLSLGIITQGNPSFYTRNILGNTVPAAMNGVTPFHPKKVMLAMRTIRGMLNAKGEITNEMIELIAGRIILDAPQVGLIKQLIEDVMENPAAAMEDLTSESARADIKAGRLAKGSKKAAKAFVKQIGKFAEASEAFSKIMVYADFKDILTEANWGSELEIFREASRLTNHVMSARSETPTLVDSFTRSGFGALLSPFLRFRVDIIRCTVNSFKLANEWRQSDNPVLRKHGQIKTAAWFGTVGILTVGLPIIMRSILGFDDEDDRYVRAANPAYNKDASLIYFRQKDENGNTVGLNTINLTYTNPLASFGDPLSRIVNATISNEPSEIPGIMGRYFVGDVLGENIVAGAVIDTWRNKDSNTGLPIYLAGESDLDKALKQAIHIGKAYTPKIGTQAYKFTQALNREEEDLPWNKPEGVLYATFAPFTNRASTFDDMDKSIFRRIHRDTAELSSLTFKATSRAPLNHGDIAGMFEKRQQLRIQQGKLLRDYMERSANIRGGDENMDTVVRNAIAAGNSRKSVSLLINQNVVERIQPPKEQLQKMGDISPVRTDEFYDWRDGYSSKIPLD
jgi:MutS domain I